MPMHAESLNLLQFTTSRKLILSPYAAGATVTSERHVGTRSYLKGLSLNQGFPSMLPAEQNVTS